MNTSIYQNIATRTAGDIYIGVVGPVRTGKSTFIKRFMETQVIPNIDNVYRKERARDELPQSGSGRTIMTAEPKFVPEEAAQIQLPDGADDFSYRRLDGRSLDMRALEEAVNAMPFLTERTLPEVRGFDFARCRDAEAEALERIVSDIPGYCTLVFVQDAGWEPDQRQKAVKALKKYGKLTNFSSQGQAPLVKWIGKRFAALGKAVTPDACLALIYSSGELMSGLIPEIEKLGAGVRGRLRAELHRPFQRLQREAARRAHELVYYEAVVYLVELLHEVRAQPLVYGEPRRI